MKSAGVSASDPAGNVAEVVTADELRILKRLLLMGAIKPKKNLMMRLLRRLRFGDPLGGYFQE